MIGWICTGLYNAIKRSQIERRSGQKKRDAVVSGGAVPNAFAKACPLRGNKAHTTAPECSRYRACREEQRCQRNFLASVGSCVAPPWRG